jgi:hypothetical protein
MRASEVFFTQVPVWQPMSQEESGDFWLAFFAERHHMSAHARQ